MITWLATLAGFAASLFVAGHAPVAWTDPSPHRAQFLTVDEGVRLEVLDWGGTGRPVVFLAGAGNTAHVFDDFAPKLTACCHVIAVTRRGYGASSRPAGGYDDGRLASDVEHVLDALQLERPVLAGHSMAGGELTTIANRRSERLGGLVYLDALGDPRDWPAADPAYRALAQKLPPAPGPPCADDRSSFAAFQRSMACREQPFPESELRATNAANADGSVGASTSSSAIHRAIGDGNIRRDYTNVRVPVLALFEFPRVRPDVGPNDPPRTDAERAALQAFAQATAAYVDRWKANLQRSVPDARFVDLRGAGHYVFLRREADVLREMRAFLSTQAAPPQFTSATIRVSASEKPGSLRPMPGGRFTASGQTLRDLVAFAWQRHAFDRREVVGGPEWVDSMRFDIEAQSGGDFVVDPDGVARGLLLMVRALLEREFSLRVAEETRAARVYRLVRAGASLGPRLRAASGDCSWVLSGRRPTLKPGEGVPCGTKTPPGRLFANTMSMATMATLLSPHADRPIVDGTGLTGLFVMEVESRDIHEKPGYEPGPSDLTLSPANGPALALAVEQQLGLKLEAIEGSIAVIRIERATQPAR